METLITIGMLTTVAGIGLGSGIDGYERELARSDRTSLLWTVLQARSEAMSGICEGDECKIGISQHITIDGEIVTFAPLSGLVSNPQRIVLGIGSSTSALMINAEGQISLIP
jgi:hypothetical protein